MQRTNSNAWWISNIRWEEGGRENRRGGRETEGEGENGKRDGVGFWNSFDKKLQNSVCHNNYDEKRNGNIPFTLGGQK